MSSSESEISRFRKMATLRSQETSESNAHVQFGIRNLQISEDNNMADELFKISHNTPPHLFRANAVYMITGAIYQKAHIISSDQRKEQWIDAVRTSAQIHHWRIIAWVVLHNHYHVVAQAPDIDARNLPSFVGSYHKFTARLWNDADGCRGRKVWWNYWDTCIRSEKDFLRRISYILWNPVKHGLTKNAEDYAYSSYKEIFAIQPGIIRLVEEEDYRRDLDDFSDDY